MEVEYAIFYHAKVVSDDLPAISHADKDRIKRSIEEKLTISPEIFGKPLRSSLKGYRKLRVGGYRIVFKIAGSSIYVLTIQHRSVVYKEVLKRI